MNDLIARNAGEASPITGACLQRVVGWNEARDIFRRLDFHCGGGHNTTPSRSCGWSATRSWLSGRDAAFLRRYNKVMMDFDRAMSNGRFQLVPRYLPHLTRKTIAYFSFGLACTARCRFTPVVWVFWPAIMPEASDLGLPFVGVGFLYPQGYFRQHVPSHGWREAVYDPIDARDAHFAGARRL